MVAYQLVLTLLLACLLAYPNAEQSLYLRNVVSVLDLNGGIASTRATEDGDKLPISGIELFKLKVVIKIHQKSDKKQKSQKKKIVGEQHEMVAEENDGDLEEETRKGENDNSEDDDETLIMNTNHLYAK
ncbi:unnamed protein product [Didymodactylos carnosus]|uniref:Uncharacterized protein n=1 Tax=Didymodactylos carnosus TaxID=1234261 RepID=A0A8S2TNC8_9BILA|nr:unnamed protein product [Didymodactylos carnosus]